MSINLELLIKIQEVDKRLDELRLQGEALPRKIEDLEAEKAAVQARLAGEQHEFAESGKRRRKKERDLEAVEEKIVKIKGQLSQVKTNREYTTILHEVEVLEKEKGKLEEEILLGMEEVSSGDARMKEIEAGIKEDAGRVDSQIAEVRREIAATETETAVELKLKQELTSQVDARYLAKYQKVREHRGNTVVCRVKDSSCRGCNTQIPPQLYVEIKKGGDLFQCPRCQRILYWAGEDVPE